MNKSDVRRNFINGVIAHDAPFVDPVTGNGEFGPALFVLAQTMASEGRSTAVLDIQRPDGAREMYSFPPAA